MKGKVENNTKHSLFSLFRSRIHIQQDTPALCLCIHGLVGLGWRGWVGEWVSRYTWTTRIKIKILAWRDLDALPWARLCCRSPPGMEWVSLQAPIHSFAAGCCCCCSSPSFSSIPGVQKYSSKKCRTSRSTAWACARSAAVPLPSSARPMVVEEKGRFKPPPWWLPPASAAGPPPPPPPPPSTCRFEKDALLALSPLPLGPVPTHHESSMPPIQLPLLFSEGGGGGCGLARALAALSSPSPPATCWAPP